MLTETCYGAHLRTAEPSECSVGHRVGFADVPLDPDIGNVHAVVDCRGVFSIVKRHGKLQLENLTMCHCPLENGLTQILTITSVVVDLCEQASYLAILIKADSVSDGEWMALTYGLQCCRSPNSLQRCSFLT